MSVMANWRTFTWEISPSRVRPLVSLSTGCRARTVTDTSTGTSRMKGTELQELTLRWQSNRMAGCNPRAEYEQLESMVGASGYFYLSGRRFGPLFLLDDVSISDIRTDDDGVFISAEMSATLLEDPAEGEGALRILYNGVNIAPEVSVSTCVHDMYAASRTDELMIRFSDSRRRWDGWSPARGDRIAVSYGEATTGSMHVQSVVPENGLMTLRACSVPPTAGEKHSRSWEQVRLLQLAEIIARSHGLALEQYSVRDQIYAYVRQEGLPDLEFLELRCSFEGVGFLVFDGRLILYDEASLEQAQPAGTIAVSRDGQFEYRDDAGALYGMSTLGNGALTGTFTVGNGSDRILQETLSLHMSGEAEANRFAAGRLRYHNREAVTGILSCSLMRGYAAGSLVMLTTQGVASWDGPALLYHVRHDYVEEKSRLFFRRPLEGY